MVVVGPYRESEPVGDLSVDRVHERDVLVRVAQDALDGSLVVSFGQGDKDGALGQVFQERAGLRDPELTQDEDIGLLHRGVGDRSLEVLGFEPLLLFEGPGVKGVVWAGCGIERPGVRQDGSSQPSSARYLSWLMLMSERPLPLAADLILRNLLERFRPSCVRFPREPGSSTWSVPLLASAATERGMRRLASQRAASRPERVWA